MNAVGIDVSKGKSMIAVMRPFGEVVRSPFEVRHHGAHYLLCRGKEKAAAELGLSFLAYNLTRAINMIGTKALIAAM